MTSLAERRKQNFPNIGCGQSSESAFAPYLPRRLLREGIADRRDSYSPNGGPAVHRKADQASQNIRRPGGDRHRERAVV